MTKTRRIGTGLVYLCMMICLGFAYQSFSAEKSEGENLLPNPSFEAGETFKKAIKSWGTEWVLNPQARDWFASCANYKESEDISPFVSVDTETAMTGKCSVKLHTTEGLDRPSSLRSGSISITSGKTYTFSIWAKGDKPGLGIQLNFATVGTPEDPGWYIEETCSSETGWKKYSLTGTIPGPGEAKYSPNRNYVLIWIRLSAEGTLWIDNASFVQEETY